MGSSYPVLEEVCTQSKYASAICQHCRKQNPHAGDSCLGIHCRTCLAGLKQHCSARLECDTAHHHMWVSRHHQAAPISSVSFPARHASVCDIFNPHSAAHKETLLLETTAQLTVITYASKISVGLWKRICHSPHSEDRVWPHLIVLQIRKSLDAVTKESEGAFQGLLLSQPHLPDPSRNVDSANVHHSEACCPDHAIPLAMFVIAKICLTQTNNSVI